MIKINWTRARERGMCMYYLVKDNEKILKLLNGKEILNDSLLPESIANASHKKEDFLLGGSRFDYEVPAFIDKILESNSIDITGMTYVQELETIINNNFSYMGYTVVNICE